MISVLIYILGATFFLVVLAAALSFVYEKAEKGNAFAGLDMALFLVMMPKDEAKSDAQSKDEKLLIAQMEQVFTNFLHLKKPKFLQKPSCVALEIASAYGSKDISFYVAVPDYLESVFEKYVQGVYPKAIIEKVTKDYTIFAPHGFHAGAYLKLTQNALFPISTYQKLEKDPLSAISNNLSKITIREGAAVQIIIKPLKANLRSKGEKALAKIREGKTPRAAAREVMNTNPVVAQLKEMFVGETKKDKTKKEHAKPNQGLDQAGYDAIQAKITKPPFETNIRVLASATTAERAQDILNHLTGSFNQFSLAAINNLEPREVSGSGMKKLVYDFSFRLFNKRQRAILNTEELASMYHFPTSFSDTPYVKGAKSQVAPPPADLPETGVNLIGRVLFRGEEKRVYFASPADRRRHFYIIGQTGTGKSSFLETMINQDIANGEGVAVIDPHGDLVEHTLANIPKNRVDDVVLFEPFDTARPVGLNMLEYEMPEQKDFAVQEMISIFYKLFPPEIIGPMFEHYMRNAMLALMADMNNPGTLVEIPKMFTDPAFLQERLAKVTDPIVRQFWVKEWAATTGSTRSDMLGYVVSKVGRFIENEMMRNIIGQSRSGFDLAKIMDEKKIFLANLSKGQTGEVNSSLLGLILVSKMQMAAMRRARLAEDQRKDFYLYVDEFQNFTTDSIVTILSEARKYKLNLTIAHQYIPQLTDQIRDAVLGNVGSLAAFRIGAQDAEFLEKQFTPGFTRFDLMNLDNYNVAVKMMLNNKTSTPFVMQTYPSQKGRPEIVEPLRKISKLKFGKPKAMVEADIIRRSFASAPITPQAPPPLPKR